MDLLLSNANDTANDTTTNKQQQKGKGKGKSTSFCCQFDFQWRRGRREHGRISYRYPDLGRLLHQPKMMHHYHHLRFKRPFWKQQQQQQQGGGVSVPSNFWK
jgi:hypothetical protein